MLRPIYTVLMHLAIPLILVRLWLRGRDEPGYREHIGERFGRRRHRAAASPCIWLHAVSVGEVRATIPLVSQLAAAYPGTSIILTCMTPTGRRVAQSLFGDSVTVRYLPYDLPWAVARCFVQWRPKMLIVMETELWPNLLAACTRYDVPAFLVNARLSERSHRRYARWAPIRRLAQQTLRRFRGVMAQSDADAARLTALGAVRVVVTGNVKFDLAIDAITVARGMGWRAQIEGRPVVLLASTRENEERLLLEAYRDTFLRTREPGRPPPLLVIVPRHPSRFDEVYAGVKNAHLTVARRSRIDNEPPWGEVDIWLGDSMGEMQAYYAMCDIAIIGGSFLPLGGQNLIEAAALGRAAIMGPSIFNFSKAVTLATEADAMVNVADAHAAFAKVAELLNDRARLMEIGENARRFAAAHRGATDQILQIIREAIGKVA